MHGRAALNAVGGSRTVQGCTTLQIREWFPADVAGTSPGLATFSQTIADRPIPVRRHTLFSRPTCCLILRDSAIGTGGGN